MTDPNDNSYGGNSYGDSGYGSNGYGFGSGYEPNGLGASAAQPLGSGDNALQRDLFSDGYQENVYAVNFADTPYTETAASPDGGGTSYSAYSPLDYADDQLEL